MTRGDGESPLRWTTKSVRNLAAELLDGGKGGGGAALPQRPEAIHMIDLDALLARVETIAASG